MSETAALAKYISTVKLSDVPDTVLHRMKQLIIDQLACTISSAQLPWCQNVYDAVRSLSSAQGASSVLVHGLRIAVDEAAFVNSTFGHANEMDDAHVAVRTHPGAVIIPAAMAIAESQQGTSGADLLLSTVVGYEIMIRIAKTAMPDLMEYNHHHTPTAVGPFGAAASSAVVLGFDASTTEHALAIAASHSGGLMQFTESGGSVKRIHPAIGAKSGIRAAVFAAHGLTGPKNVLEGNRGFLEAFGGAYDISTLTNDLGVAFYSLGVGVKMRTGNYTLHAPLEALEEIQTQNSLTFSEIDHMTIAVSSHTIRSVGAILEPTDALGAQFSLRFALAVSAKYGFSILEHISEAELRDSEVIALAHRITIEIDERQQQDLWNNLGCALSVTTRDGHTYEIGVVAPLGSPERFVSDEQIEDKFRRLVEPVLGADKASAIVGAIWSIEATNLNEDLWPHLVVEK